MNRPALQFRPDWKMTLFTGCLLPLLVGLGFWQLDRADQKAALAVAYQQRLQAPAQPVEATSGQPPLYQRLVARGHYDNDHTFLLDNRLRDGRFGYEVVSPLELAGDLAGQATLLVNRGWVAADPARRSQPSIDPVPGEVTIRGYAYHPQPLPTKAIGIPGRWPVVAQWVDLEAFAAELDLPLQPYVLRVDQEAAGAFRADWPLLNLRPEQHTGYAVQWFAMATTLVLAWLVLSTNVWAWWNAREGDSQ